MSESERNPLPADERGHGVSEETPPQPVSDSSPPERPRKSRLRPPPPDWQPQQRSDPRAATPMVVVYSGDSERPAPDWSQDYQSSRLTLSETPHLPTHEPFPLASDLEASSGRTLRLPALQHEQLLAEVDARAADAAVQNSKSDEAPPESRAKPAIKSNQPPQAKRGRWGVWAALLVCAGTLVAVWTRLPHGQAPLVATVAPNRAEPVNQSSAAAPVADPIPTVADAIPVAAAEPSASATPAVTETAAEAPVPEPSAAPAASAAPSAQAAEASPPAHTVRVVLDVSPRDSKLTVDGVERAGTPPYRFDVPRGGHIILKIERQGYITRRVDLDGNKAALAVGLLRKHRGGAKHSADAAEPEAAE